MVLTGGDGTAASNLGVLQGFHLQHTPVIDAGGAYVRHRWICQAGTYPASRRRRRRCMCMQCIWVFSRPSSTRGALLPLYRQGRSCVVLDRIDQINLLNSSSRRRSRSLQVLIKPTLFISWPREYNSGRNKPCSSIADHALSKSSTD